MRRARPNDETDDKFAEEEVSWQPWYGGEIEICGAWNIWRRRKCHRVRKHKDDHKSMDGVVWK